MNKYTFTDNHGATWERVTKPTARKAYRAGAPVTICACNLRPFGFYNPQVEVSTQTASEPETLESIGAGAYFERLANAFTYYNCMNTETGKYPAFYIRQEAR